jgi:CHAT domain-containing protein/Tfp pilus assembly protein PilF
MEDNDLRWKYLKLDKHRLAALSLFLGVFCVGWGFSVPDLQAQEATPSQSSPEAQAQSLSNQAEKLKEAGQYAQALELAQKALSLRQQSLGNKDVKVAESLEQVAELYMRLGKFNLGEPIEEEALAIYEKVLGPEQEQVAKSLNNLGRLYREQGKFPQAEASFQRALKIQEKTLGPEHQEVGKTLNSLAVLNFRQQHYRQAEQLYKRSLAIFEKVFGSEHQEVGKTLFNLGGLYVEQLGDYRRAEQLYKRSLAIFEKTFGTERLEVAKVLTNLANLYRDRGEYERAEPLYKRALAIFEKILEPNHPDIALTYNNLARLYILQKNYQAAETVNRLSLAMFEKALGANHPNVAQSLTNLGELLASQGDYVQAKPLFERTLAIWEKVSGSESPQAWRVLQPLADLYRNQGNDEQAEIMYRRSLATTEKTLGSGHPNLAVLFFNWALLQVASDKVPLAIQSLSRGLDIEEANAAIQLSVGSESQMRSYLASNQEFLDAAVWLNLKIAPDNPAATSTALTALLRRKGRLLDVLSNDLSVLRGSLNSDDQQLVDELANKRRQLSTLVFRGIQGDTPSQYQDKASTVTQQINGLEDRLAERSSAFRLHRQSTPTTIEAVQKQIPTDAALIEWVVYKPINPRASSITRYGAPRYAAYLLTSNGSIQAVDLGETASIDALIRPVQQFLRDPKTPLTLVKQTSRQLNRRFMQPILDRLPPGKRHLLIAPDSALNLIPFAALVDEQNHYLAENFVISYLSSGRDLLRFTTEQVASRQPPLILANPNYNQSLVAVARNSDTLTRDIPVQRSVDLTKLPPLPPLPATGKEAQALAKFLPNAQVLTGRQATENALKETHAPRILHLATHGFFLDQVTISGQAAPTEISENPLLRSGLALAGFDNRTSGSEDGVLTALEVSSLDLQGTALVVLSACDTGLGQVRSGEGVYGLRRAFTLAGAQSQLVSLWKVEDQATLQLMEEYYRALMKGGGRSEALRQSQLKSLSKQKLEHPFYWAGFILSGDWRPLPAVVKALK